MRNGCTPYYGPLVPVVVLIALSDGRIRSIPEIREEIEDLYGWTIQNIRRPLERLERDGLVQVRTAFGADMRGYITAGIVYNPELYTLSADRADA